MKARLAAFLFSFLCFMWASPTSSPQAKGGGSDGNIQAGLELCEKKVEELNKTGEGLADLIAGFEKEFKKDKEEEENPTIPPEKITTPTQLLQAKLPKKKALEQAREALSAVKLVQVEVKKHLKAVKKAPNFEKAAKQLQLAISKIKNNEDTFKRIHEAFTPGDKNPQQTSQHKIKPLNLKLPPWVKKIHEMAETDKGKEIYDGYRKKLEAVPVAPSGNKFFQGEWKIKLPSGGSVDLRILEKSLEKERPGLRGKAIFQDVPPPPGIKEQQPRLTPQAVEAIYNPESYKKIKKVGGVALEVVFDLLSIAGLPDFRKTGPASVIKSPILLSLKELYSRLLREGASPLYWQRLPDELRYPGGLGRIHGVVLSPEEEDVFLVGTKAMTKDTRIDIRNLILGIETVWLKGETPAVSLDPKPKEPGGPQYVRVYGVPMQSEFAKIMVDADYAMKRIIAGEMKVNATDFQSLADILRDRPRVLERARFWFYPSALGAGDIYISSTTRSFLLETKVRVLTEDERLVAGGFTGTGRADPDTQKEADLFTSCFEQLEKDTKVRPHGVFARLHGLLDIVTMCKLIRMLPIDYPILKKFSELRIELLKGNTLVPEYYPGITVRYAPGAYLSGGVLWKARVYPRNFDQYQDTVTSSLENEVDTFKRDGTIYKELDLTFPLPSPQIEGNTDVEKKLIAGYAAMRVKDYSSARKHFTDATKVDPLNPDAWANLALARSHLKRRHKQAKQAIIKAVLLEPDNLEFQEIWLDIAWRADPQLDLDQWENLTRQRLSTSYTLMAFSETTQGQYEAAWNAANSAVQIWEDNPDAHLARAMAHESWDPPERGRDLMKAIRGYRKRLRSKKTADTRRLLAIALIERAQIRFFRLDLEDAISSRLKANDALEELQRVVNDVREAREMYSSLPSGLTTEAHARALRCYLLDVVGRQFSLTEARSLADLAIKKHSDFSHAFYTHAVILILQKEYNKAVRSLSKAIGLDPTYGEAFRLRAQAYATLKMFSRALSDIEKAIKFLPQLASELEDEKKRYKRDQSPILNDTRID